LTQPINSFFSSSKELSQLSGKVRQLRVLQSQYELVVPPSLHRASHVAQIEQGNLTLMANNSAVAAKLRQMTPELLKQLQLQGSEVTVIQVRVQVTITPDKPAAPHPALISTQGKVHLNVLADSLLDSPLKLAIQRLAGSKKTK
jgi:hypothetical protein